jgi:hypothetical protein
MAEPFHAEARAMRRAAKVDANQQAIIATLEGIGATVAVIGQPVDLLVGFRGRNWLIECKNPKGRNRLTPSQTLFMVTWRGQKAVVRTADEALDVVTADPLRKYGAYSHTASSPTDSIDVQPEVGAA